LLLQRSDQQKEESSLAAQTINLPVEFFLHCNPSMSSRSCCWEGGPQWPRGASWCWCHIADWKWWHWLIWTK
jgi:hypothetical protein